jgi:hypothetical protein
VAAVPEVPPHKLKKNNFNVAPCNVTNDSDVTVNCGHYWPIVPVPDDR